MTDTDRAARLAVIRDRVHIHASCEDTQWLLDQLDAAEALLRRWDDDHGECTSCPLSDDTRAFLAGKEQ